MTREQLLSILQEGGVENPSKLMVNAILDVVTNEKKELVAETESKAKEQFKDYKSPKDYEELVNEVTSLKDAGAKAARTAKYKESKIADKWLEFVDSKLKDSKDFDKELASFIKENPELLLVEKTKEESKKQAFQFGGVGSEKKTENDAPQNMYDAVKEHYKNQNK